MKASGESDSPDKADSKDKKPGSAYKLYAVRWYILAVVAMLNLTNAMVWISFAPIANYTDEFYGDDSNTFLSLIFMVVSIPFGFLAMWFVDRMGLKLGIWTGGFLSCAGGVIRVVSSISKVPHSARLAVVIVGQFVAACAQPFIMYLPTKLAALWFPDSQRAVANTIGSMSNPLGILCAMLISPAIVDASLATSKWEDQMLIMNVVFAALAGGVAVMCLFVTRSEPPSPPTSSAAQEPSSFKDGFVACWRNRSFVVLMICLGGGVGLFSAMYTLIQQVMCVKGYSNTFSGICGALLIVGGLIGSAIAGLFVDKTKMFKEVIKVCYLLAAATACAFAVLTNYPNMKVGLAILCTGFGFFGFALYPVGLEAGVECTFPTAEATSSGLIVISGQVIGIVILLVMQMVLSFDLKNSADWSIEVCSAIYFRQVIGIVILLVMQMVLSFDLKNSADWSIEVCSAIYFRQVIGIVILLVMQMVLSFDLKNSADWSIEVCSAIYFRQVIGIVILLVMQMVLSFDLKNSADWSIEVCSAIYFRQVIGIVILLVMQMVLSFDLKNSADWSIEVCSAIYFRQVIGIVILLVMQMVLSFDLKNSADWSIEVCSAIYFRQVIGIVILLVMQMVLSFDLKNSADWSIEVCSAIYFRQVIGIVILLVMQMVLSFDLKNSADWSIEVCSAIYFRQVIGIVILLVMQMVLSFDLKNSADWSIEVCSAIYFRQVIGIVILLVMQMVLSFDLKNSADWSIEVCSAGGASGVVPVTNMMPATLFWAAVACAFAIGVTLFFNPKYKRLAHERKLEKEAKRAQNIAEATANPGTIIILPDNIGTYGSTDELSTPVAGRRELPDGDDEVTIRGRDNRNFVPDEPEKF